MGIIIGSILCVGLIIFSAKNIVAIVRAVKERKKVKSIEKGENKE